jgi:GntR family transcriptional repressor for pyruvate dehydrogenase complex
VLAEQFSVTRVTLRGALGRLAACGLVHAHQGRGTVVCDFEAHGGPDLIGGLMADPALQPAIARDLLAVRRALAGVVLERVAALRPDPEPVRAAVLAFEAAVLSGGLEELAVADLAVLRALIAGTGSTVFRLCLNPIIGVLQSSSSLRAAIYRSPEENLAGWQALSEWVESPVSEAIPAILALLAERDRQTLEQLRCVE